MTYHSLQLVAADTGAVSDTSFADAKANMSYSVWLKFPSPPAGAMTVGKYENDNGDGGMFVTADSGDNQISIQLFKPSDAAHYSTIYSVSGLYDGNWHNIVATYDGVAGNTFYLDGSSVSPASTSGTPLGSNYACPRPWSVGFASGTAAGNYAYPQVFYTTLSSGDAATIAAGNILAGAEAVWLFTEGSGTTAADSSGNGFNLTFNSITAWSTDVPFTPSSGPTAKQKASAFLIF